MGKEVKRSFVFNIDWRDVLMDYPAEVRYEVYDAIIEYAASGKLLELKPLAKMAFSFIKKEMDFNNERYLEIVAKRSEAGRKGMSARYSGKKEEQDVIKLTKGNKTNKSYQTVTNVTSDNKTNYNEYDNDNDNIKENTPKGVQKKEPPPKTPFDNFNGWLKENAPNVTKLKTQMTEAQYKKVREQYSHQQLVNILLAMENYKELTKKYTSVYLTFLKWAKKEYGTD